MKKSKNMKDIAKTIFVLLGFIALVIYMLIDTYSRFATPTYLINKSADSLIKLLCTGYLGTVLLCCFIYILVDDKEKNENN